MIFQDFHEFNRLVEAGFHQPLECGFCHTALITQYDEKDGEPEPILYCWQCDDYTTPGLNTLERVRKAIKDNEK